MYECDFFVACGSTKSLSLQLRPPVVKNCFLSRLHRALAIKLSKKNCPVFKNSFQFFRAFFGVVRIRLRWHIYCRLLVIWGICLASPWDYNTNPKYCFPLKSWTRASRLNLEGKYSNSYLKLNLGKIIHFLSSAALLNVLQATVYSQNSWCS